MKPSEILALVASAMQVVAFVMYNWRILRGPTRPNPVSWGIWAAVTILNFTSYQSNTGDWWKSLLPTVSSIMCILTFAVTMITGRRSRVGRWDVWALVMSVIAAVTWLVTRSASQTNTLVQVSLMIGFIPTWRGVWLRPQSEPVKPWLIWSSAYGVDLGVVLLRWTGHITDLYYPALCIIAHAVVGILALRKK